MAGKIDGSTMRRVAVALAAVATCGAGASDARAQTKEECVAAYEQTQALRREGQLRKARERVLACSQEGCPAVVKKDCAAWLPEVEASIPTVVFEARDPGGADTTDVKVFFDGAPLKERLDGKAVPVDPGQHTFRYEFIGGASAAPIEEKIVVREGDKNRKLSVSFATGATPSGGGTSGDVQPPDDTTDTGGGGVPTLAWVLGGVGIVGIGAFATLGILGLNEKADKEAPVAEGGCAPNCTDDEVSSIRTKLILADVSLGVGVVALGVATYLIVTSSSKSSSAAASAVRLDAAPTRGGGFASVRGSF